jgi:hypothetical protein
MANSFAEKVVLDLARKIMKEEADLFKELEDEANPNNQ